MMERNTSLKGIQTHSTSSRKHSRMYFLNNHQPNYHHFNLDAITKSNSFQTQTPTSLYRTSELQNDSWKHTGNISTAGRQLVYVNQLKPKQLVRCGQYRNQEDQTNPDSLQTSEHETRLPRTNGNLLSI